MRGCLKAIGGCIFGIVLVAALAATAFYLWAVPELDELFADSVRREFMLPPSSTVRLEHGSLQNTMQGRVQRMVVEADEAKIEGLAVEDVKLAAEDVRFDVPATLLTRDAQWDAVGQGTLSFKASEAALKERWTGELESRGLKKVDVKLSEGEVSINGLLDIGLLKMHVGTTGQIAVDGSDRIVFQPSKLQLGDTNVGVEKLEAVFDTLTPVLDLGKLKLGIGVEELEARDGYLHVKAKSMQLGEIKEKLKP
jgi:hypothetical protein